MEMMTFWSILGSVVVGMIAVSIMVGCLVCRGLNRELSASRKEVLDLKDQSAELHQKKLEAEKQRLEYWEKSLDDAQERTQVLRQYKNLESEKSNLETQKKELEVQLKESQKRNQEKNGKIKMGKKAQYELEKEISSLQEEISILESEIRVRDGEIKKIYKALQTWKNKDDTINALLKQIDQMQMDLEQDSVDQVKKCCNQVLRGRRQVEEAHRIAGKTPPTRRVARDTNAKQLTRKAG